MNKEEKAFIERFVRKLIKENGRAVTRKGLMLGFKNAELPTLRRFYIQCLHHLDSPYEKVSEESLIKEMYNLEDRKQ